MLSRFFLIFDDSEMSSRYGQEKKELYKKATPIIAVMLLMLGIAMEILYMKDLVEEHKLLTRCITWVSFGVFVGLAFLVRVFWWTSWFVCPILTALIYYYFAFHNQGSDLSIVYFTYLL